MLVIPEPVNDFLITLPSTVSPAFAKAFLKISLPNKLSPASTEVFPSNFLAAVFFNSFAYEFANGFASDFPDEKFF